MPDSCPVDEVRALLRLRGDRLLKVFRSITSIDGVASAISASCAPGTGKQDGTHIALTLNGADSFRIGQPDWTLTAMLLREADWLVAMAYQPFTAEWFIATPTATVHVRRRHETPLVTRRCGAFEPLVIGMGDGTMRATAAEREALRALKAQSAVSRPLSAAYGMCLLAMGQLDVMVETGLKADELRALEHVVIGAGGMLTDWCGSKAAAGQVLAAGSKESHERARELLAWGGISRPRNIQVSGLPH